MKNSPLLAMISDSFDRMFIVDKRGKITFFPWGDKKVGYRLKSKSVMVKAKKFYNLSFIACFVVLLALASIFNSFWGILGSMFVSFGGWYLVYFLYTSKIVSGLPVANASYTDIVLEKLEPEGTEETSTPDVQIAIPLSRPLQHSRSDFFTDIKRFWYRLSPGQLFVICLFACFFTGFLWSQYRPESWANADYLVGFLACLLLGYGGFIVTQDMRAANDGWFAFFRWKFSFILIMIVGWVFAAWFLYKFVVLIFS